MSIEKEIQARSGSKCELCGSTDALAVHEVAGAAEVTVETSALLCGTCMEQIDDSDKTEVNHWRCINDSMWSEVPAVQVLAWRMLHRLRGEGWPQDLLDMLYLDEEILAWAKAGVAKSQEEIAKHIDANGVALEAGDSVVLIKDLKVKGANFTAKRGTAVRRISLVFDNPEHIEGRVNDQRIVILTKYVKKTN